MSRKQFVVSYPDRSKSNISRSERDRLLLSLLIEPIAPNNYRYIGKALSCHQFADLSKIKESYFKPIGQTGYMSMNVLFEHEGRRRKQPEAYPGELELQLREQGAIA